MSAQDLPPEPKSALSHAQVTVIRAGRLIDPDSATVLTDQEILIAGNKVAAVGKQLRRPKDAKLIDLSDKTVLPDCHTHLVDALMAVNGDPFNVVKKTAAQMVLAAVPNAEKTLLSGLTSVRDVPFTVTHCSYEGSLSIGARVCCPD
jgi:imidazolonepropionase-like amidohydrolase